jgi:hypothetical protein
LLGYRRVRFLSTQSAYWGNVDHGRSRVCMVRSESVIFDQDVYQVDAEEEELEGSDCR